VSLDKDASSDPNLKAVHAGASMRKAQHLQPKASDIADAEVGYFAFSRLAAHSSTLQVGGKAHFASKTINCWNDPMENENRKLPKCLRAPTKPAEQIG
jgi:hypothetical protein